MLPRCLLLVLISWLAVAVSPARLIAREADWPRIKANNVVALREHVGKNIVVVGRIESTAQSASGHHFLNFQGRAATVFCPKEHVIKFKSGPPAEFFKDKEVEIEGRLEEYQGRLQIRLTDPVQIKTIDSAAPQSVPKAIELKQIGSNVWLSPAGLKYQGHDPEGLTRVEHILRHVADQPTRAGPHGVFDGGQGVAFAVIDEAWELAKTRKLKPTVEGDRSSYLVPMNRRIGFLGGKTGRERGHPPLERVFIVFESNTTNIVTAFPK